jgi:hypothetical protein
MSNMSGTDSLEDGGQKTEAQSALLSSSSPPLETTTVENASVSRHDSADSLQSINTHTTRTRSISVTSEQGRPRTDSSSNMNGQTMRKRGASVTSDKDETCLGQGASLKKTLVWTR